MATQVGNGVSNKYSLPTAQDRGAIVWDALEDFIERMASHTHTGVDSPEISLNISKQIDEYESGTDFNWVEIGDSGNFTATFNLAANVNLTSNIHRFFNRRSGESSYTEFYPRLEIISTASKTIKIYSNRSDIDFIKVVSM